MKKCKRILSLALASAMVMGMFAMSASALDGDNDSSSTTTVEVDENGMAKTALTKLPVSKTVKVNKNTVIPDDTEFTFTMVPAGSAGDEGKEFKDTDGKAVTISSQTVKNGIAFNTHEETVKDENNEDQQVNVSYGTVTYTYGADTNTAGEEGDTATQVEVTQSDKYFDLTQIPFDETGVYRYYVTETTGSESYITYDTTKYEVDVYVIEYTTTTTETVPDDTSDDPSATKEVEKTTKSYGVGAVTLRKMTKSESGYSYEEGKPTECSFTNEVKVNNVTIKKTLEGTPAKTDQEYTFYIRIPAGGDALDLTAGTEITAVKHKADASTENVTLTVKADNGLNKVTTEEGTTDPVLSLTKTELESSVYFDSFTLKPGESLELVGMPQGMIFYLAEADYTDQGYSQYWKYTELGELATDTKSQNTGEGGLAKHDAIKSTTTDDGTVKSSVIFQGTVNTTTNEVEFINSRIITANTGISVDLIPYVLVMLIALCGAGLFFIKKRNIAR